MQAMLCGRLIYLVKWGENDGVHIVNNVKLEWKISARPPAVVQYQIEV